jgi:hypothetical protein
MKFNKWTLGLAAIGAVSLASAVTAQGAATADSTVNNIVTGAAAATVLSGYVDTSAHWNPGTGNGNVPAYAFNTPAKADGFNLDAVKVSLEKPLDESEWASGYRADVMFGPDANALGTTAVGGLAATDFAIRQAYVALRTPICNVIDWKIGVFDTVIGYETIDAVNNPNYTRSYGYTMEPTTHTGIQAAYQVCDVLSASVGIANTFGPTINGRAFMGPASSAAGVEGPQAESYKTYMGAMTFTAPTNWGSFAGSTLTGCIISGFNGTAGPNGSDQTSFYVGTSIPTPISQSELGSGTGVWPRRSRPRRQLPRSWRPGSRAGSRSSTWPGGAPSTPPRRCGRRWPASLDAPGRPNGTGWRRARRRADRSRPA